MIFHEIYGCYYNAVACMIREAIEGTLTETRMYEIVSACGYEESVLNIIPAIRNEQWQLITKQMETPILYKPQMPLTEMEKRWLKTILSDPRIRLFLSTDPAVAGQALADVEPLFLPEDIVYFDRYQDGDDYEDPKYIANFHILREAIREKKKVSILYENRNHCTKEAVYEPLSLEYSDKEDKFRLLCVSGEYGYTLNLDRIRHCRRVEEPVLEHTVFPMRKRAKVVLTLTDERNVLERVMMKFSHLKKQVTRVDDRLYEVEIAYDKDDETDILIQILSFGPFLKVKEGEKLREELKRRLEKQLQFMEG